ncbi:ABC-2 family transporter protein [Planctomycetes bacterium CA13]|uniref:ABC-2 family transporter protein n=1 Tax=Novipirellula herctigrandis TaxID=2527986 RepID=A0A5C5YNV1_9BACT|nr:ABC-2 family transporter protein [Planctomycetes bacterium CA13]
MNGHALQSRIFRLFQKELRETIRDRRTVMTLLIMPLLLYPLLSMALNRFLLTSNVGVSQVFYVGVGSEEEGNMLSNALDNVGSIPPKSILDASSGEFAQFDLRLTEEIDPVDALRENKIDVAVSVDLIPYGQSQVPEFTITAYRGDGASEAARRILVERLQWLRSATAQQVAQQASESYVPPAEVVVKDCGDVQSMPLLATIVPLVLVLMTITGAVYPAIDLTAGERERGTMEALMASPVPRFYVLFAKYVAVVIVALLTAMVNLFAMFTTLWASGLLRLLTGEDVFPWLAVLQILGLLVLFSGFFSAVLLSLTSFAKSFKEAQSYLIPVMLLALAPAMLSLMPGVKLSGPLAIAPLISIVILARDILAGTFDPVGALAAVLSTCAYAVAALAIASRLFGNDAVMRTSDQSIGSLLQRPKKSTLVPSAQSSALLLALLVPIYFVASNGLMRFLAAAQDQMTMSTQFWLNGLTLVLTFGLVPLIAAYLGRNEYRTTYRWKRPAVASVFGAVLIGLGAWALAHEAFVFAEAMGIGGLSESRVTQTLQTLEAWKQVPTWLLLLTFALAPAVIEELCFRGFLFSSLSTVLTPGRVIVVTAVLFGVFHVLTGNALLIERFVPTTLLGLILGWIAYRTGSVIPGMVMHFVHNALLNLVGRYHDSISFFGSELDDQAHLPAAWLAGTMGIALVGVAMVWFSTRDRSHV